METELISLNKRIRIILEEKELPNNIKEKIKSIYQEYKTLCEEVIKEEMKTSAEGNEIDIIEENFDENNRKAIEIIKNKYKEKYIEKAEVITIVLSTLEDQKSKIEDKQIKESEKDILDKCLRNSKENYVFTNNIINIVIDSIENSKNQLFRTLNLLGTTEQKMEYINSQIKLIENTAKLKLGSIKEELDIEDEQISKQIFSEYEQYNENKEKNNKKESQNAHQKFVNEYKVSEEELQQVAPKTNEDTKPIQQKEYETLPGNVIE